MNQPADTTADPVAAIEGVTTHTESLVRERLGTLLDPDAATAVFNKARTHRYLLTRRWAPGDPLVFVMLNPSTADALADDPTIRRCIGYARRESAAGIVVLNLFAARATDPRALTSHRDPVGASNDAFLARHAARRRVIAAWGTHGRLHGRDAAVTATLGRVGTSLVCLGLTRDGLPRHPLYTGRDAPLKHYEHAEEVAR